MNKMTIEQAAERVKLARARLATADRALSAALRGDGGACSLLTVDRAEAAYRRATAGVDRAESELCRAEGRPDPMALLLERFAAIRAAKGQA